MTRSQRYLLPAVSSYLFFLTLFGWVWVVNRVGATEPIARSTKRYAILAIFPLVMIASIGLVTMVALSWRGLWVGLWVFGILYLLATAAFWGLLLHRIIPANKLRKKTRHVVIALLSLGLSFLWCTLVVAIPILPFALGYGTDLLYVFVYLWIVFVSVVHLVSWTVLISTMRRSHRNHAGIVIGVLISIMLGGWTVMTMLHDPSRSPYSRYEAMEFLTCGGSQVRRVTRIDYHTWFSGTKYHSWWGIPISRPKCGE